MSLDKLLVTFTGLSAVVFTYWFFLMKKDQAVSASGSVDIKVEGGYTPEVISVPVGQPTQLNFLRTDSSSCLEEVVLGDFRIRKFLPLNRTVSVTVTPKKAGTFDISCGMNMFHGKLIAK